MSAPESVTQTGEPEAHRRRNYAVVLVVTGLIVILAGIAVTTVVSIVHRSLERGTHTKASSDLRDIYDSLRDYAAAHGGAYPATLGDLEPTFGGPLPKDPYTEREFFYVRSGSGFRLECLGKDNKPGGKDELDSDILYDEAGPIPTVK